MLATIPNVINGRKIEFNEVSGLEVDTVLEHKKLFIDIFKDARYKQASLINKIGMAFMNTLLFSIGIGYYFAAYLFIKSPIEHFRSNDSIIYEAFGFLVVILFLGIVIALSVVQTHLKTLAGKEIHLFTNPYFNVSFLTLSIVFVNLLYNHKEVVKLKSGKPNFIVEFKTGNAIIKSDTNNIFIGQTQNYLFLYNRSNRKAQSYKISDMSFLASTKLK